ncbi:hypothetical protein [Companilactobacillus paralimentarius]|uniref:hypothetical protein n=1 Tax=Companilactobacillus paralimentarius TaxID=83526 RepID=UPI0037E04693
MKKSIKYAGIAAATLLAVAPVAAPAVSSVSETTVKAATDTNTSAVTDYANQYNYDYTIANGATVAKATQFGNGIKIADFENDAFYKQIVKYALSDKNIDTLTKAGTTVNVSAVTTNGTAVSNVDELNNYLSDATTKGVKLTITFNYKTSDGATATAITKPVTVTKAAVQQTADLTSAAVSYDKSSNVSYNASAADYNLKASANFSVKDNNGNVLTSADKDGKTAITTTLSGFFTSYNDAYNATTNNAAGTKLENFNKENATYYQVITGTFAANSAFATLLTNHATTPANYGLTVNGTTPTGSYTDPTSFQTKTNADGTKSITVIREIHVGSKEAASWTTTDTTGVVTTKTAHNYYTLKNDNNQTIANRALGANTPWRTDKVRTNANGEKQYRVATGEWIDADDVVYSNGNDNNNNNGSGLTDIKTVSGVATLTKAKGYFMALFNDEGKAYDNKYLGSPSAWRVDRTAKGADGKTYYRVATSEWLQAGEGVSFK